MSHRALIVPLTLTLTLACGKKEEAPKPKFEPGPMVDVTLASVGGVTLKAPNNLKVNESDGEATLAAEGFPTVTISHQKGEQDGVGTRTSTSMGKIEASYTIPTARWTCTADKAGDHEELIVEICSSLTAPNNPNVSGMTCKTVTGYDGDPVVAAWSATAERFTKCFEGLDEAGVSFGFNFELEAGSRSFTQYTSPMVKDDAASKCLDAIYEGLKADPAFTKEGLEAGQIECDGSYSRY